MVTNCETCETSVCSVHMIVYVGEYGGRHAHTREDLSARRVEMGPRTFQACRLQNLICTDVQTHTERLLPPVSLPAVEFRVKSVTGRLQLQEKHILTLEKWKRDRRRRTGSEG